MVEVKEMAYIKIEDGKIHWTDIFYPQDWTYTGLWETTLYPCDHCGKERSKIHEFIQGDVNNPTNKLYLGTECVKGYFPKLPTPVS